MLSVQSWLQYMEMHPWHSWQLSNNLVPLTSGCNALVYEYAWQNAERAGRKDIRRAIARASDLYAQYANYYPSPHFAEVTVPWPVLGNYQVTRFSASDPRGHWLACQLPEGHIQKMGYEHITTADSAILTFYDLDNDNLYETAVAVATVPAGTTSDEILITFDSADYIYDDNVEITAREIQIVGTTATITFDTPCLVRPILYTLPRPSGLDPSILPPTANSPFASTVNVARRFCDPTGTTLDTAQAVFIWETAPFPYWATSWDYNTNTKDPSALAYAIGRAGIRDARQGVVYVGEGVYNSTTDTWTGLQGFSDCRPPDRVTFRYQAGVKSQNLDIVIARLSAAELARPICACQGANKELYEWQLDLARTGATDETYQTPQDAENPFGSRRGHVYAWRSVQQAMVLRGLLAG